MCFDIIKNMRALDKRDIKLIREIDFDARASISRLARKIRVSKEVANYRLKRLVADGVIKGFIAIIDSYMLGYHLYRVQVRLKRVDEKLIKEMTGWAKSIPCIASIVTLDGKWDLELSFWSRNPSEFNQLYESFLIRFGSHIQRKTVSIILQLEHLPYNFLYERMSDKGLMIGTVSRLELDKKDNHILDILSKNCRTPFIEIAKKVGLTANAVKYRIKALEDKRVIKGYSTILNTDYFRLSHYRVMLYLSNPSMKKQAHGFLKSQKDVLLITQLIGASDIRFEIVCDSPLRIHRLIDELNRIHPDLVRDYDEIITKEEEVMDFFPNK